MKKNKFLSFVFIVILTISTPNKIFATSYFDTYFGNIPWYEEKAHLYALAIELKREPDTIGYIAFRLGTSDNRKKINARINRIKKHLFSKYGFNAKRIVFAISDTPSQGKETMIILQPILKDTSPLSF
jgi:hypothetical protein